MAFAAWQLPQTQDFLNKVGVTQAQTQSNDSRTLSNANDKTAANSEPDSNGSDTNQTAAPTDNQSQLAIKTLTDADAVITPAKDLSSLLLEHAQDTSAEKSFNQLLVTWGRSKFYEHANACNNLKILGLRCLYQKGQWEHVVKLNRPVILELSDAQAAPHHLLVTQADADTATVRIEENTYTVPISEIISAWNGSYLVFWQPERPEAVSLFWGSNSEAVIWLREQLDGLGLVAAGADRTRLFDADLVEAVKKFQSSQGILADGIVGSETFLVLNNAIGVSGRPNLNMDVK
jgi:general secretion pathway protein A